MIHADRSSVTEFLEQFTDMDREKQRTIALEEADRILSFMDSNDHAVSAVRKMIGMALGRLP